MKNDPFTTNAIRHYNKWLCKFLHAQEYDVFVEKNIDMLQDEYEMLHPHLSNKQTASSKVNFIKWTHTVWADVNSMYDWIEETVDEIYQAECKHAKFEEFATE